MKSPLHENGTANSIRNTSSSEFDRGYAVGLAVGEEQRQELVKALKLVEWALPFEDVDLCPRCEWKKADGHAPDCEVYVALQKQEKGDGG